MKKNYFVKNLMAATMLLTVSTGMTSCDDIVINIDNPTSQPETKPETNPEIKNVTFTDEGAKVSANNLADVNAALAALVDDIKEKGVGEGKEYIIEVASTNISATATSFTVEIPKVENSNITLVFDDAVATTVPLLIKSAEATSTSPTTSVNYLTITLPDLEGLDLEIDMPETTVYLKSSGTKTILNSLTAKTAISTTYVGPGVTVQELKGGTGSRTIVQNGGVVETYVYPSGLKNSGSSEAFISVCYDEDIAPYAGVLPPTLKVGETVCYEISTDEEGDKPYLAKYLKVVKESEDTAKVNFLNPHGHFLEKMTVGDGAIVFTKGIRATEIVGEGTAKIVFDLIEFWLNPKSGMWHDPTPDNVDEFYSHFGTFGLKGVEKISNIIFANPLTGSEDDCFTFMKQVSATVENCTFQYDLVKFGNDFGDELGKGTEYTLSNGKVVKNCKFETRSIPYPNSNQGVIIHVPDNPVGGTFTMTFDNCEFKATTQFRPYCNATRPKLIEYGINGQNYSDVRVKSLDDIPYNILDGIDGGFSYIYDYDNSPIVNNINVVQLEFKDCKVGGSDLTATPSNFPDPGNPITGLSCNYICKGSSGTSTLTW